MEILRPWRAIAEEKTGGEHTREREREGDGDAGGERQGEDRSRT